MKKKILIIILSSLLLALSGCGADSPATSTDAAMDESAAYPFSDISGLSFSDVFAYAGPYVEDGSNEDVDNVAAVRVANRSGQSIQYAAFTVSTGAGDLHFTCTTLLPEQSVLLLEQSRAVYTGAAANEVKIDEKTIFSEEPTLYPDTFSVSVSGHVMTLSNVSDQPVPGDIYVYFKRCDEQGYLGGITYRVHFTDLAAGAQVSKSSQNLSEDECEILFIGCANPPEVRS